MRAPDAVRPCRVRGALDAARGVPPRRPHPRARAEDRRAGLDDAVHDPHGVEGRLLALLGGRTRSSPDRLAAWVQADGPEASAAATKVRRFLSDGPRKRAEIVKALGLDTAMWYGASLWVDLVRIPPSGTWTSPRGRPLRRRVRLARCTTRRERTGRHRTPRAPVPHRVRPGVTGGRGEFHRVVPHDDRRGARPDQGPDVPGRARHGARRRAARLAGRGHAGAGQFLPVWDANLLTHARRTQVLPERYRARIFNSKTPHSFHTFLVDGQVAGTWRWEGDRIEVESYDQPPPAAARTVRDEADRLRELFVEP